MAKHHAPEKTQATLAVTAEALSTKEKQRLAQLWEPTAQKFWGMNGANGPDIQGNPELQKAILSIANGYLSHFSTARRTCLARKNNDIRPHQLIIEYKHIDHDIIAHSYRSLQTLEALCANNKQAMMILGMTIKGCLQAFKGAFQSEKLSDIHPNAIRVLREDLHQLPDESRFSARPNAHSSEGTKTHAKRLHEKHDRQAEHSRR